MDVFGRMQHQIGKRPCVLQVGDVGMAVGALSFHCPGLRLRLFHPFVKQLEFNLAAAAESAQYGLAACQTQSREKGGNSFFAAAQRSMGGEQGQFFALRYALQKVGRLGRNAVVLDWEAAKDGIIFTGIIDLIDGQQYLLGVPDAGEYSLGDFFGIAGFGIKNFYT